MRSIVALWILVFALQAQAGMDLHEFLDQVKGRHKTIKAIGIGKEAAEDRRE